MSKARTRVKDWHHHKQKHYKGVTLHHLARIIAWLPVLAEIKFI
jgi:hypothetical protein